MPQLIRPPGQSQEVAMTIEVIGNRARTEILHLLSNQGPQTTSQLAGSLGTDRSATLRHLLALERSGYVRGDLPSTERARRKTIRWEAVQARIDEAAETWRAYAGRGHDED